MVTTSTELPSLAGIGDDFRGLIRDLTTNVTSALHVALIKEQEAACPDSNRTWAGPLPLPKLPTNSLLAPWKGICKERLAGSSQSCWQGPVSTHFFHYVSPLVGDVHVESQEPGLDSAVSSAVEAVLFHWLTSSDPQGRLLRARLMRVLSEVARVDAEQELDIDHGTPNKERPRLVLTNLFCTTTTNLSQTSDAPTQTAPKVDEEVVTSEEAAKLLHVSRTHINKLVEKGELGEVRKTEGGHRRILRSAVMAYKEKSKAGQFKGLEQMMAASAALGHYDDEMNNVPLRRKS